MKKRDILPLLYQLASPIALMVVGLVFLINPDSLSILISRLIGWAAMLGILAYAIYTFVNWPQKSFVRSCILFAVFCASFLLLNSPLLLAKNIGRFLGLLILLRGIRDILLAQKQNRGEKLAIATIAIGAVLILLPMTASRLIFRICGGVIFVIGIAMLFDRLKDRRYLGSGGDDNIIDAL